jgi:15-cis-phytoene desaturase
MARFIGSTSDEVEVKVPGSGSYLYGLSPVFKPFQTFSNPFRNHLVSWREAWKLLKFFISGSAEYLIDPRKLDELSVLDYAKKFHLNEETIRRVLVPLTAGLFFIPPDKYSAYVFFGPFVHALRRFYRVRIGAFRGGMTEVLAGPIAERIVKEGGSVTTNAKATALFVADDRIQGVRINDQADHLCDYVVMATSWVLRRRY